MSLFKKEVKITIPILKEIKKVIELSQKDFSSAVANTDNIDDKKLIDSYEILIENLEKILKSARADLKNTLLNIKGLEDLSKEKKEAKELFKKIGFYRA